MAAKPLILRVKWKQGQFRLESLTGESTVEELKAVLYSLTGVAPIAQRLLTDFPPRPLDTSSELRKLDSLSVRSGDTIILEEDTLRPEQHQAPSCPEVRLRAPQRRAAPPLKPLEPGVLLRRVVPADNSCLFMSVYFALSGGDYDPAAGAALRQVIADTVAGDCHTYNEAFLGRPNREYCTWILNEEHWGGAIELSILSRYYMLEIVAVDAQNVRLHRFGEDAGYSSRILLLYDGIHYDPLLLESLDPSQPPRTLFSTADDSVLTMALEVAREAKASRQYTDVQNFTLRCLACDVGLVGQEQARKHAAETGHVRFGEV
uniref:Ubiquitin thioesterase OTU n=1 Tax=Ornithodoros turicata TaxID=34597 RepID=A0A2R5LG25_9ACAR